MHAWHDPCDPSGTRWRQMRELKLLERTAGAHIHRVVERVERPE